jgi:uncharacterized protein YndB with AHSA1/START domain
MSEAVVLDFELKSPIERVWHALTDSATLSKWMMFPVNNFQAVVGHAFQFSGAPGFDASIDCEVLEVDEPNKLSYTWATMGQGDVPHTTVVSWTLSEAISGVTRLHLEQSGFRTGARQELGGARASWKAMVEQLQEVLVSA